MFREMRRFKQQMSTEECRKLLTESKRAVLSVLGDDGYPYGVPVNFFFNENENRIYIHSAVEGHKLDSIKRNDKVSFTVINEVRKDEESWFYYVDSVIVFGTAKLVDDPNVVLKWVSEIGYKYMPGREEADHTAEKYIKEVAVIAIDIEHMAGKHVREK